MQRAPCDEQAADRAEHQRERQREQEAVAAAAPLPPPHDESEHERADLRHHLALLERVQRHDAGGNTERFVAHVENLGEQEGIARARNLDADGAESGGFGGRGYNGWGECKLSAATRCTSTCDTKTPNLAAKIDGRASCHINCRRCGGFWNG